MIFKSPKCEWTYYILLCTVQPVQRNVENAFAFDIFHLKGEMFVLPLIFLEVESYNAQCVP